MLQQMDHDPKGKRKVSSRARKHNYSFSTAGKEKLSMIGLKKKKRKLRKLVIKVNPKLPEVIRNGTL